MSHSIGYPTRPLKTSLPHALLLEVQSKMGNSAETTTESGATGLDPREYSYLTPIRTSGARPPLFGIFPGPPGSREFAEMLPEDQPIYDLYFSELSSESVFPTVEQLAVDFIHDLRKVQAHGPYQLCGYSNAGLVAYEMARLLLSQGEEVSFLALFDAWHPEFTRNLPFWELARYRTMRFVDRLWKYGRILHQGQFDDLAAGILQFVDKRAKLVAWRVARFLFRTTDRAAPAGMKVIESIISLQAYSPKPYERRFMLIRPNDPVDKKLNDLTVGWHVCATAGVDVHFVPTLHGHMMDRPYVRAVVEKIAPYLADVPTSSRSRSE
jgi:thioesterase domain-containing protein